MRVPGWFMCVLWSQFATAVPPALDDPMQPPLLPPVLADAVQAPPAVDFQLNATKVDPGHHTAIINGHLVAEGDALDGATVLKISPAAVVIKVGADITTLKLNANVIKHHVE